MFAVSRLDSNGSSDESDKKNISNWKSEKLENKIDESNQILIESIASLTEFNTAKCLDDPKFRNILLRINNQYTVMKRSSSPSSLTKLRLSQAKLLLDSGFISLAINLFKRLTDDCLHNRLLTSDGKIDDRYLKPIENLLTILYNYSDQSEEFSFALSNEESYLEYLTRYLLEFRQDVCENSLKKELISLLRVTIICAYNLMLHENPDSIKRVRESPMLEAVKSYLNFDLKDTLMIVVLLFLAYSVDEKQAELFLSKKGTIDYYISLLKKTLKSPNRRSNGYSTEELAKGLERLAKNDTNKKQLVEQGVLPVLNDLAQSQLVRESELSYLIVWTLAFEKTNKGKISEEIDNLLLQVSCRERSFKTAADQSEENFKEAIQRAENARLGALWVLQSNETENQPNRKTFGSSSADRAGLAGRNSLIPSKNKNKKLSRNTGIEPLVMISYSWSQKPIVLKIANELKKRNIPIWIDVEQMQKSSNTLDAMAEAIEKSSYVIVSMSESYKSGQNTRLEAEYAYRQRKKIIPIVVESKYRPDGWLGLMIGAKLFYDFGGKYSFDQKIEELVSSFQDVTDGESHTKVVTNNSNNQTAGKSSNWGVSKWSNEDVKHWAKKNNLSDVSMPEFTGQHLLFLKRIQRESSDQFYRCLENQMHIKSVDAMMRFVNAFDQLSM